MHKRNTTKDSTLEKMVNETAKELGVKTDVVWKVFNHFYYYTYGLITRVPLKYFTRDKKREECKNITIPGFGRLLNRYGKVYKDKGVREEHHKTIDYDKAKNKDNSVG